MDLGFDGGFTKIKNNNTFNKNDKHGLVFVINLLFVLVLLGVACIRAVKSVPAGRHLTLVLIYSSFMYWYYSKPAHNIHMLYAFSCLITAQVRTPEFLDLEDNFTNYKVFESNYQPLKDEVLKFVHTAGIKNVSLSREIFGGENDYTGSDVKKNEHGEETGWRLMALKIGDNVTSTCLEQFPVLAQALGRVPEVVSCALSILEPGVMIPIHIGYYKGIMRYMLPLQVPDERENCFLWVNGIKYSWAEGKSVLWDDTYPHKVFNNTKQIRIVLFMDVLRPLTGFMNKLNHWALRLIQNSQAVKDEISKTEKRYMIPS